jgi:hypothetical protein
MGFLTSPSLVAVVVALWSSFRMVESMRPFCSDMLNTAPSHYRLRGSVCPKSW